MLSRLSFSHSLLASFLLIATILGAAALGGLFALESFVAAHGGTVELLPSARGAHFRLELPHEA